MRDPAASVSAVREMMHSSVAWTRLDATVDPGGAVPANLFTNAAIKHAG
jgi:hypothetical protein